MDQNNIATQQSPKNDSFLPLQLATKYYIKWDCQIQIKSTPKGYYKCLQGQGEVEFQNGNKYKGNFYNGLMHGHGQFIWANGLKYKGQFINNAITGTGTNEWSDGSWYKGELLNSKRHGKGEYFSSKDNSKYNGDWKQGSMHGFGLLEFSESTFYEGQLYEGLRQGQGKMKYPSGNTYQGAWEKDKKSGYGVMNWLSESQIYEGEWKDDLQHGIGTYYWFDGKIEDKIVKKIYKGNWVNGERHGYGSFFYSNGCRYQGYFEHNLKHGEGLAMDENGNVKLQCFEKDRIVYTIPDSNQPLASSFKQNINNEKMQKKSPQILSKLIHTKKQPSNSVHVQSVTTKGAKLSPLFQKTKQGSSSISQLSQINQHQPSQFMGSINLLQQQARLKVEQNMYTKCLDIPKLPQSQYQRHKIQDNSCRFLIGQEITNLLLRENSHLRQWYKHCSHVSSSVSQGNSWRDLSTGVTIQNLCKLVKDLKIIDEFVTLPKINREFFYSGWKSTYDIALPDQNKLKYVKQHLQMAKLKVNQGQSTWQKMFNNQKVNYSNIQWVHYGEYLQNLKPQTKTNKENIDLNPFNDIHQHKIILYRHFVSYLLRIAYLQTLKLHVINKHEHATFQKYFRLNLQKLFKTISSLYQNAQKQAKGTHSTDNLTFVSKEKTSLNISEDYTKLNQSLFDQITNNYRNLQNFADNTVTVKVLYQLLEKFSILKEPNEKVLFLEKVQRFMEPEFKHSLLRKDMKSHFSSFQKVIYTSPYFQRILKYSLIEREFSELLYLAVNRKISSISRQDAIRKYRELIQQIIGFVKHQIQQSSCQKSNDTLKFKKPLTEKDKLRLQLVRQDEEKKAELKQMQRKRVELKREQIELSRMKREDFRWDEDQSSDSDGYFD